MGSMLAVLLVDHKVHVRDNSFTRYLDQQFYQVPRSCLRCSSCVRGGSQVYADNACECHTAAIKQLTKVRDQDLIYVSFHNKVGIVLDRPEGMRLCWKWYR